jgi:hypothetical protein
MMVVVTFAVNAHPVSYVRLDSVFQSSARQTARRSRVEMTGVAGRVASAIPAGCAIAGNASTPVYPNATIKSVGTITAVVFVEPAAPVMDAMQRVFA